MLRTLRPLQIVAIGAFVVLGAAVPGLAQESQVRDTPLYLMPTVPAVDMPALTGTAADELSEDRRERMFLQRLLEIAPPAPMPDFKPISLEMESYFTDDSVVAYDPVEGREYFLLPSDERQERELPEFMEGFFPSEPVPDEESVLWHQEQPTHEGVPEDEAITPTAPYPFTGTTATPYRTVFKMLMRYNVSGTNYYFVCSASTRYSYWAWTAGHCVYSHDPNGDDPGTPPSAWADEIWLFPAQTDRVFPWGLGVDFSTEYPYGEAKMSWVRSYSAWTGSEDITYDWAWLTLNRRVGDRVGWMGWLTGTAASLNIVGYPAETPYVPSFENRQYFGFDSGNVANWGARRISLDAFTYGGHSGGPAYWYDGGTGRYVAGVHSTSNRVGGATDQRVTTGINDVQADIQIEDDAVRQPVARPEIVEYVLSTTAKGFTPSSVDRGDTVSVEYNAYNAGHASTTVTADFRLSTNTTISTGDRDIGSRVFSLGANVFRNTTATLTVPTATPAGTYYVGWLLTSSGTEYGAETDQVVIGPSQLTVTVPPPDLTVSNATISQSEVCTNQSYTINATIQNVGKAGSLATTPDVTYRQSTNSTISTSDPTIGTDECPTMAGGASCSESISVSAPATAVTRYIGACVAVASGEIVTSNQCSTPGRQLTVVVPTAVYSNHTFPGGVTSTRAGHSITANPYVTVPTGADVRFAAESVVLGHGFTVANGGLFAASNLPAPAGCP